MQRHAAFLRGMNVGGHRLTNEELRGCFTAMGFAEVATFRASGNVIFAGAEEPEIALERRIEAELESALGYAVPTFVRAAADLRAIAARRPFAKPASDGPAGKLQVALLTAPPSRAARSSVLALANDEDRLELGPRELYWLPRGGTLDSALDMKALEQLLGPMTMRTMGTVELIAGRYFSA
jgi:uncharacterized protein (DUF1697 family)